MIESFLVYSILMLSMVSFSYSANQALKLNSPKGRTYAFGFIISAILIFSIVFGARWDVGIDHLSYLKIYQNYGFGIEERESLEPGFVFINRLLATHHIHFFFFFFLFAVIQISFLVLAFKSRKQILPFIFIILMSGQFMGWMNIMRQETVVCVFIWLIMTIDRRSFMNYSFWIVLCAFFFHKSAIILIPLYPIIKCRRSFTGSIKFQIIIFIICFWLGYTHYILSKLEGFGELAILFGYEQYGNIDNGEIFFKEDFNWGIRSWIRTAMIFTSIILSAKVKYLLKAPAYISLYNFFFWGSLIALVCTGIDVIVRVFAYFSELALVVYGYTFYYVYVTRKKNNTNFLIFALYTFLNILVFAGTLYATNQTDGSSKFQFFWQV